MHNNKKIWKKSVIQIMIVKTHDMCSVILFLFQQLVLALMRNMVTTFGLRTLLSLTKSSLHMLWKTEKTSRYYDSTYTLSQLDARKIFTCLMCNRALSNSKFRASRLVTGKPFIISRVIILTNLKIDGGSFDLIPILMPQVYEF